MSVVATVQSRIEEPQRIQDLVGAPLYSKEFVVTVVIQASDYSSGFVLTNVLAACGGSAIAALVVAQVKIAAGTPLFGFGNWDTVNNKARLFTAITNQTTATDYTPANGDIWTLKVTVV